MSLSSKVIKGVTTAFNGALADAVSSFTYRKQEETFDANTNTVSLVATDFESRGVFTRYKSSIIQDTSVLDTDVKLIVLQNELAIVPAKHDQIIKGTTTFTIESIKEDPVSVTWMIQCRD